MTAARPLDAATVAENLTEVRHTITAAGGDPDAVRIVAVTKGFGPEAPRAALSCGLAALGENYAQELEGKAAATAGLTTPAGAAPEWHFIGRLQSNKIRLVADAVAVWQSIDRPSLVAELARRAPGARVLIQVNATGEDHKGGCAVTDTPGMVERARAAGLDVAGLMTVGVFGDDVATGRAFEAVRALVDDLELHEASMGMSGDLGLAVANGTTMVRVGTALFGPRPRPDDPSVRD